MTEIELSQYRALKQRVERNEKKIKEIEKKDIPVVAGKVTGSSKHFPYIETHFGVQMYEPKESDNCSKRISSIQSDISRDKDRIKAIEDFINAISDPELQTVFELRVYEKMSWIEIAVELDEDKDRTTYSKKFKNYLDSSHVSPISQNKVV